MTRTKTWVLLFALACFGTSQAGCGAIEDLVGGSSKKSKKSSDDEEEDEDSSSKKKKKKKKKSDEEDEERADATREEGASSSSGSSGPTPPPPAPPTPPTGGGDAFAGVYRSTYGDVRVRPTPTGVSGTYPGGELACTASGSDLDCDWKDSAGSGKAKLTRQSNGDLSGTWGYGASATSGGSWLFALLRAGDPGSTGTEAAVGSFAGQYVSTYGTVVLNESGGRVTGTYPGGSLVCAPSGAVLNCDWREGGTSGRAILTRQANGDLSGTWGNGGSATSGGSWLFRKK
jgi:hypothetical protein